MLERLIEDTKVGDFTLDLNPSANRIFAENGAVEKSLDKAVNLTYDLLYRNRNISEMSDKEKVARLAGVSALIGTLGTVYVLAETTCRGSESAVRGTGKLAKLGYQKAANQWVNVENFGQKVADNYKHLKRKVPKSVKNLFNKIKDYLVVGLSVAAIGLSYVGVKSCGEEPEPAPQEEPAPTPTPTPTPNVNSDQQACLNSGGSWDETWGECKTNTTIPTNTVTPTNSPTPTPTPTPSFGCPISNIGSVSSNFDMYVPALSYTTLLGTTSIWARFKFSHEDINGNYF